MTTQRVVPPSPGNTPPGPPALASACGGGGLERGRHRPACPRRSAGRRPRRRPGRRGRPDGRRPSRPPRRWRPRRRRPTGAARTPSGTPRTCPGSSRSSRRRGRPARSLVGMVDVDRLLLGGVLLRVEDLLRRAGQVGVDRVDARPATGRLLRRQEAEPGRVREQQAVDEDLRRPREDRGGLRVGARRDMTSWSS